MNINRSLVSGMACAALALVAPAARAQSLFVLNNSTDNVHPSTIQKFTLDGAAHTTFADSNNGVVDPEGLAFNSQGDAFVTGFFGSITEYAPDGTLLNTIYDSAHLSSPFGIAVRSDGTLFVGNRSSNSIVEYAQNGTFLGTFAGNAQGISTPYGLAFDPLGDLFVANNGSGAVSEFSPAGTKIRDISASGALSLAFTPGGDLLVGPLIGSIQRFSASGVSQGAFETSNANFLYGLAVDPGTGNVYAGDANDNKLFEFSPTGTTLETLTSADGLNDPLGVAISPAPEPPIVAGLALGVLGLGGLVLRAHRRKARIC